MIRAIRAKLLMTISENWFLVITIGFLAVLNYEVLLNSGLLQARPDSQSLNQMLRFTLLINNFDIICQTWGLLLPIYLGCRIMADDYKSGQIYIALAGNPRRIRYLLGNWLALVLVLMLIMGIIVANYWLIASVLKITTVSSDFFTVMGTITMNMFVLLTITSAVASAGTTVSGIVGGLAALTFFNLSAYKTIPFMAGSTLEISMPARRVLAMLAPIQVVYAPSLARVSVLTHYIVSPYFFDSLLYWQVVYIPLVLAIGITVFAKRDL